MFLARSKTKIKVETCGEQLQGLVLAPRLSTAKTESMPQCLVCLNEFTVRDKTMIFFLSMFLTTRSHLSPFCLQMILLHLGPNLPTFQLLSFRTAFLYSCASLSHKMTWKSLFSGQLVWYFISIDLLKPYFPVYECLHQDTWNPPPNFA